MRKRLTKTIWYGSDVDSNGNPILPSTHGGLDGLNYGELFLHLSNGKATLWTLSSDGKIVEITGGGSDVDMSSYLLKSIWDKVFEIRTDSQGIEYIFGKLPMVTQYGITMYSGDGVDVPSLASGLPFDGRTIWYNPDTNQIEVIGGTGGGSGEGVSNFWDLSGIPSWITNSKPKYTYSEIEGTPDLSGYATESWVLGKSYITSATLGTELGKYVTLDTDQSLKGKKDFKNGLSIDGLELRKSQDDVVYLDANLVVRGGVTMYAQNEVDIPSIIDSIPTASTTVKGIASFDGAYFSVVNGKVSLIASNVGLNEEELYNYLTSNNYAKKSDIPSLVGYATQSWVENKKYLTSITSAMVTSALGFTPFNAASFTKSNIKSTLGISDWALASSKPSYTTSEVSEGTNLYFTNARAVSALAETLKSYVTLSGTQTITGEKNFTGGLKVNGSPIYYDTDKKYWKLEGDLLVTGGVTMYGSDSSFVPSTIMDAIAVDGTTISKSGGVLKVIGGTGGGVADSVAWANITGKPTWIGSSKPSYSYSEITGAISTTELQNYLTQNSYLNVTSGDNRYLKLSGGTLKGSQNVLIINRTDLNQPCIAYEYNGTYYGSVGLKGYGDPFVYNASTKVLSQIYHKENISTLKTDLGLGTNAYTSTSYLPSSSYTATDVLAKIKTVDGSGSGLDADLLDGKHLSDILSSNVASATKLQTARTIWGQLFDGSNDISGNLSGVWNLYVSGGITLYQSGTNYLTSISTSDNAFKIQPRIEGTGYNANTLINPSGGSVGIGTTSPSYKLDVNGGARFGSLTPADGLNKIPFAVANEGLPATGWCASIGTSDGGLLFGYRSSISASVIGTSKASNIVICPDGGFLGVGVTTPSFELEVKGAIRASTYVKVGAQPDNDFPNFINAATTYSGWHTLLGCNGRGFIFGQDREDSTIAKIQPYGSTTAFRYTKIESAVEISNAISTAPASIRFCMNQGGGKDGNANIEFMTGTAYIDWHYAGDTSVDYTTRLIEGAKGILTLKGGLNIDTTLSVTEDADFKKRAFVKNYITFSDLDAVGGANTSTARIGTFDHNEGGIVIQLGKSGTTGSTPSRQRFEIINAAWNTALMWVDRSGNMLVNGGITMYSDQRKKTILNHVELSLKDIANAPLIEHYYNSDESKTTHVGSIAQYWAAMNDWFCKLDSEGYYIMEIQNAALASAISIARELDRYENKTDKAIKKLKKRICELEEEVERLKSV